MKLCTIRALIVLVMAALLLSGCTRHGVEVDPDTRVEPPTPTPAPTPTPEPLRVLFVTDNEDYSAYTAYVEGLAHEHGALVQHAPYDKYTPLTGYKAMLFVRSDVQTELTAVERAISLGKPVAVLDLVSSEPIDGAAYSSYIADDVAGFALDEALVYPPHDTPVRLLALLEAEGSPGDNAYRARIDEGKIFDRGIFYRAQDEADAGAFLNERLERYVEGLTDAIIVEGKELFEAAMDVLDERGRTDMEVFLIPEGTLSEQQAYYKTYVFPLAMGADIEGQLTLLFGDIIDMLNGKSPHTREFMPSAVSMDEAQAAQGP